MKGNGRKLTVVLQLAVHGIGSAKLGMQFDLIFLPMHSGWSNDQSARFRIFTLSTATGDNNAIASGSEPREPRYLIHCQILGCNAAAMNGKQLSIA
ncbi:hypothetical protein F4819DRAFT_443313 [Hypoxylon fuscum]|nr:hypothetical protein F4819DRAFT_443313 [Hypoxylon fuscum]